MLIHQFLLGHINWVEVVFSKALPPVHPILVNFTAALIPGSVFSDLLGRFTRRQSLVAAGWWMLLYAAIVTPFTVLAGWYWRFQMEEMDMAPMTTHAWLGTVLAAVFVPLLGWRWRHHREETIPGPAYLACAGVAVILLIVQGHLGATMSFGLSQASDGAAVRAGAAIQDAHADHEQRAVEWRDSINLRGNQ